MAGQLGTASQRVVAQGRAALTVGEAAVGGPVAAGVEAATVVRMATARWWLVAGVQVVMV